MGLSRSERGASPKQDVQTLTFLAGFGLRLLLQKDLFRQVPTAGSRGNNAHFFLKNYHDDDDGNNNAQSVIHFLATHLSVLCAV